VTYEDVPWPEHKAPQDILRWLCRKGQPAEEMAAVVRVQQLRWHPDRFTQALGSRIKPADAGRIMERVKSNAQFLNLVKQKRVNPAKLQQTSSSGH